MLAGLVMEAESKGFVMVHGDWSTGTPWAQWLK